MPDLNNNPSSDGKPTPAQTANPLPPAQQAQPPQVIIAPPAMPVQEDLDPNVVQNTSAPLPTAPIDEEAPPPPPQLENAPATAEEAAALTAEAQRVQALRAASQEAAQAPAPDVPSNQPPPPQPGFFRNVLNKLFNRSQPAPITQEVQAPVEN